MKINSFSELEKIIQGRLSLALKMTQQDIYNVIQENIKEYYEEKAFYDLETNQFSSIPSVYDRTYQFLNSLIKTDINVSNGKTSCSVKINTDSLNYMQDGLTVVQMIESGYHADKSLNDGDYQTPRNIPSSGHFWSDSIEQLGGYNGILQIMKNNCRKVGLPIK